MTPETKSEIIIASVLAAFVALLWWMNKRNGGGTGLEGILPVSTTSDGAPLFNVQAAPGSTLSYTPGNSTFNIGGPSLTNLLGAGSCNCPASSSWTNFGSSGDMAATLASVPGFVSTAQDGLTNWN